MMGRLRFIAETEQVQVLDQALALMVRVSDGGMRDVLSLFDQVLSYSGSVISEEDVIIITGVVSRGILSEIAKAVLTGDTARLMEIVYDVTSGEKIQNNSWMIFLFFSETCFCIKQHQG